MDRQDYQRQELGGLHGLFAKAMKVVIAVDARVVAIGKIKLDGVTANGTPSADHDTGEMLLIGATILPA